MDLIRLEGVLCRCRVGVPAWERKKRQRIELDLELEVDVRAAAKADDLRLTADYWAVEKAVRTAVEGPEFHLLEALAETAAAAALAAEKRVKGVTVRALKRPAVMAKTRAVVVAIHRIRSRR